ncbi:hypothetical protein ACFOMD_00755 [Sphingoaurantiacus capsulatus]|uniref:Uncharacterized protein n=1 Tax=Sphingoaurantiacus capsulatus TaxID=1771310 RepID=A0ABV7X5P9_9SPHN
MIGYLLPLLPLAGLLLAAAAPAPTVRVVAEDGRTVTDCASAEELRAHAERAASEIAALVGGSATKTVRLVIDPSRRVPYTEDPVADGSITIRLPAARLDPANVAGSRLALHHELTHAIAPGAPGMDRLLVEGLAVWVEDRIGIANYPDFELTPAAATRQLEAELGLSIPLAESERARMERPFGDERRLAYAQQGAFAGWLIERFGLPRFLAFYRKGGDWREGFGASLDELEREWRKALAAVPLKG